MKILWVVNMLLPDCAEKLNLKTSASGGWLIDFSKRLSCDSDIELGVVTCANVDNFTHFTHNNVKWFVIPGGGKSLLFGGKKVKKYCAEVLKIFEPDLIHLHGTEYSLASYFVTLADTNKILLTIQGILGEISKHYFGNLTFKELFFSQKIKLAIKGKTSFMEKKLFLRNAKRERKVLEKILHMTGRTEWDKSYLEMINPKANYYRHNYNLRDAFYKNALKWRANDEIAFLSTAGNYPLKGIDVQIRALEIVKQTYPDVKLYIPGFQILNNGKPHINNSYVSFLLKLIKKMDLENNVVFLPKLNQDEVCSMLLRVNACIVSSAVEGASATACEAMMVGCPIICSYCGGMTDLIDDRESGFLYNFNNHFVLANRMKELIKNKELATKFSHSSYSKAEKRHDRDKNYLELKKIYSKIIGGSNGN